MTRPNTLWAVTGDVAGIGKRQHCIRATNKAAAWANFQRAYPDSTCRMIEVRPVVGAR